MELTPWPPAKQKISIRGKLACGGVALRSPKLVGGLRVQLQAKDLSLVQLCFHVVT